MQRSGGGTVSRAISVNSRRPLVPVVRQKSKMEESISRDTFEFRVPVSDQQRLIDRILETGDGGHSIRLFGLPGYLFPETHDMRIGGICVKSQMDDDHQVRINLSYRFLGDQLQVYNIHTWGGLDIDYVTGMLRAGIAELLE